MNKIKIKIVRNDTIEEMEVYDFSFVTERASGNPVLYVWVGEKYIDVEPIYGVSCVIIDKE